MKPVRFHVSGDFSKTANWLEKLRRREFLKHLDKYGRRGVIALQNATPVDTGLTADSWYYEIVDSNRFVILRWGNTNTSKWNEHVNIALLLENGHVTRHKKGQSAGWVEGLHFIEPAITPILDEAEEFMWEEVKNG